jgi:flagellin-like protein
MEQTSTRHRRAVSPVIGVVLMVAITVILAAVIGVFVLGLGDSSSEPANAGVDVDTADSGTTVTLLDSGNVKEIQVINGSGVVLATLTEVGEVASVAATEDTTVVGVTDDGQKTVLQTVPKSDDPGALDTDGDGLTNSAETDTHSTDPTVADTDGDGLDDGAEVTAHGTNPTLTDTDNDGLLDDEEVNMYSTDPTVADTDGDGATDGEEVAAGTDPTDASDTPIAVDTTPANPSGWTMFDDFEDGDVDEWSGGLSSTTTAPNGSYAGLMGAGSDASRSITGSSQVSIFFSYQPTGETNAGGRLGVLADYATIRGATFEQASGSQATVALGTDMGTAVTIEEGAYYELVIEEIGYADHTVSLYAADGTFLGSDTYAARGPSNDISAVRLDSTYSNFRLIIDDVRVQ